MKIIGYAIIFTLILFAVCIPWYTNGNLNPDLLVLIQYLKTMPEEMTLADSLKENVFLVYCAGRFFNFVDPRYVIFALHNVCIIILAVVLIKNYKPAKVLIVLLFCYFTIILNQFRFAFAISLFLVVFESIKEEKYLKSILFFLLAFISHLFAGVWFSLIFLFYFLDGRSFKTKFLVFSITVLGIIFFLQTVEVGPRYLGYLLEVGSVSSKTYLFTFLYLLLFIRKVNNYIQPLLVSTAILVFVTSSLPSISGRLGELSIMTMILFQGNERIQLRDNNYQMLIGLFLALLFFAYRFNNWIIKGTVDIPTEISL